MKTTRAPAAYLYDLELCRQFNNWINSLNRISYTSLLNGADKLARTLNSYLDAYQECDEEKARALSENSMGRIEKRLALVLNDEQVQAFDAAMGAIEAREWDPCRYPYSLVPGMRGKHDPGQELVLSLDRDFKTVMRLFLSLEPLEMVVRSADYCFLREIKMLLYRRLQDKHISQAALDALRELRRPFEAVFSMAFLDNGAIEDYVRTELEEPLQSFLSHCASLEKRQERMLASQSQAWRNEFTLQQRLRWAYLAEQRKHFKMRHQLLLRDSLTVAAIQNCYAKLAAREAMPEHYVNALLGLEDPLKEIATVYETYLDADEPAFVWKAVCKVACRCQRARPGDAGQGILYKNLSYHTEGMGMVSIALFQDREGNWYRRQLRMEEIPMALAAMESENEAAVSSFCESIR